MLYSMFETASEPPGIDDAIPFAPAGPQDQAPATASDDHPRTHVAVFAESGTVILVGMADEECVDVPAARASRLSRSHNSRVRVRSPLPDGKNVIFALIACCLRL